MPVVTITARWRDEPDLASVANALARAIGGDPNDVWVYWQPAAAVTHDCPLVVVRAQRRSDEVVGHGIAAVGLAVATMLDVPVEDVWVTWEEVGPRRVFAGGSVLDQDR